MTNVPGKAGRYGESVSKRSREKGILCTMASWAGLKERARQDVRILESSHPGMQLLSVTGEVVDVDVLVTPKILPQKVPELSVQVMARHTDRPQRERERA